MQEFAAGKPTYGGLCGTARNTRCFRQILITDLNRQIAARLLSRQPKVNQKTSRLAIVAHEIAHQDLGDVVVEREHCSNDQYSNHWLIAGFRFRG